MLVVMTFITQMAGTDGLITDGHGELSTSKPIPLFSKIDLWFVV